MIVSVHSQWPSNFGYGGYFGGYYPANDVHAGETGFTASATPFYGHSGRFVNYRTSSLPSCDAFGNQVRGYGQVQDTPELVQAKAVHVAARAHLIAHVVEVAVAATPVIKTVVLPVESVAVCVPVAYPISRKNRRINELTSARSSTFAYGFSSRFAYNHYAGSSSAYNNYTAFLSATTLQIILLTTISIITRLLTSLLLLRPSPFLLLPPLLIKRHPKRTRPLD